jgi:hypothetical protein
LLADFKGCASLGQDGDGGTAADQVEFSRFDGEAKSLTPATIDLGDSDSVLEDGPAHVDDVEPAKKRQARPIGVKAAKEDQKISK